MISAERAREESKKNIHNNINLALDAIERVILECVKNGEMKCYIVGDDFRNEDGTHIPTCIKLNDIVSILRDYGYSADIQHLDQNGSIIAISWEK